VPPRALLRLGQMYLAFSDGLPCLCAESGDWGRRARELGAAEGELGQRAGTTCTCGHFSVIRLLCRRLVLLDAYACGISPVSQTK